jgi:hypothetical protein
VIPGAWRWALAWSLALFAARLWLAGRLGFADAEALYACYAMHPQPAYLDHPGLVGSVMRLLGGGSAPTPVTAHRFAAVAATALPWCGVLAARGTGAPWRTAIRTFFALAFVPEIAIGLFAVNPDLLLAYGWLGALGLGGLALRSRPGSFIALLAWLGAAASAALATLSKVSGGLVALALLAALAVPGGRRHARTAAPWLALLLGVVLLAPVVAWEVAEGVPLLRHRLVATQSEAGLSLRNVGAVIGGQLLYVTPPFLWAAWRVLRGLPRDDTGRLLRIATLLPASFLVPLCLWSRVAEPHWLAPAYLGLALGVAHVPSLSPRLRHAALATGAAFVTLVLLWVGTPLAPRHLGALYRARDDLANDLYAWAPAGEALTRAVSDITRETGAPPALAGPHWTVCAQAHTALGPGAVVGCVGPIDDDFDRWFPRHTWQDAPVVLFVSDDRFSDDPALAFPERGLGESLDVVVRRGGAPVRTVTLTRLDRIDAVAYEAGAAEAGAAEDGATVSPARSSSSRSPSGSGFAVVSRRSP